VASGGFGREILVVGGLFTVACVIWFLPVAQAPNRLVAEPTISDTSDATASLRDYQAFAQQGTTPFTITRDRYIAAPEGASYSWDVNVINALQPLFIWTTRLAIGFVAAWNAFLLLGFVGTGVATYALLRYLRLSPFAAVLGAYGFAFSPWMFAHARWGGAGLIHLWPLPLAALLAVRAHRTPSIRSYAGLGLAIGGSFYVLFYIGGLVLVGAALTLVAQLLLRRSRAEWRTLLKGALITGVGVLATMIPAFVAAAFGGTAAIIPRDARDFYGAGFLRDVLPSPDNPIVGSFMPWSPGGSDVENFLGLALLGAVCALVASSRDVFGLRRARTLILTCWFVAICGVLLSPGLRYDVGGLSIPTPSLLASEVMPQFRIVSRYAVLAMLAVTIASSVFVDRLLQVVRRPALVFTLLLGLVAGAVATVPPLHTWDTAALPAHDRWLASHPSGIVAIYPMLTASVPVSFVENDEFAYQFRHHDPLFDLYGGDPRRFEGTREMAIRAAAKYLNSPDTDQILASEHVRYVVVRKDAYRLLGLSPPTPAPTLRLVYEDSESRIYVVRARPLPQGVDAYLDEHSQSIAAVLGSGSLSAAFASGFYGPETQPDGSIRRWARNDATLKVASGTWSGPLIVSFRAWSAQGKTRTVSLVDQSGRTLASQAVTPTDATVNLEIVQPLGGTKTLRLVTNPGPQRLSPTDARQGSIYMSTPTIEPILYWKSL
jgi:hypothetical protein